AGKRWRDALYGAGRFGIPLLEATLVLRSERVSHRLQHLHHSIQRLIEVGAEDPPREDRRGDHQTAAGPRVALAEDVANSVDRRDAHLTLGVLTRGRSRPTRTDPRQAGLDPLGLRPLPVGCIDTKHRA